MSEDNVLQKYFRIDEEPPAPVIISQAHPVNELDQFTHIVAVAPLPITVPRHWEPGHMHSRIIHVPGPAPQTGPLLSSLLMMGRQYHPLCRGSFVEKVEVGYYYYERRMEWRTCALAAMYAGAFGAESVERPDFSYTQALWRLSRLVGFKIGDYAVDGPTGRRNNLADEMIQLVDENKWSRAGVAEWLMSEGL